MQLDPVRGDPGLAMQEVEEPHEQLPNRAPPPGADSAESPSAPQPVKR